MKKTTKRNLSRSLLRAGMRQAILMEALEPRTLLSATIVTRVDLANYDSYVTANVDGQPGFEIVAIKSNVVTVINESANTVQNFTFSAGSTVHVANPQTSTDVPSESITDLDANTLSAEIYATNGNFFTTLNVNTGVMQTFNVGPFAFVAAQNLDGQPGLEYVFTSATSPIVTVVNPRLNSITRFNVGNFNDINFANLDGQAGMDIYTTGDNVLTIINPNTQVIHTFHFASGVSLQAEQPPIVSPLPTADIPLTQDLVTVSGTDFTVTNLYGTQPFSLTTGNTPVFGPINLDGQSGSELIAISGNSAIVINDRLNTMRTFTFASGSTVELSFLPDVAANLLTSGTKGLIFATKNSSITTLNISSGAMKTYSITAWSTLLTDDFGGTAGSQIVTANGNSVTIINPSNGTFHKYSVPTITSLNFANLDSVAGDEIYLTAANSITILNPRLQTFRTFTIGAYAAVQAVDLDGRPGDEIYAYTLGGKSIIVLNPSLGSFRTYNVGTYTGIADDNLDGQPGSEIMAFRPGGVTILNARLQTFKSYAFNTSGVTNIFAGPVGSLPGRQLIFISDDSVIVLNAAAGTFKVFTTGTTDFQTIVNLGPPNNTELLTITGTTITLRNLATGSATSIDVNSIDSSLLFDDLDGKPGDEIFFFSGTVLTVIKAV